MKDICNPVKLSQFKTTDRFWTKYHLLIRDKVIMHHWKAINDLIPDAPPSHSMHNFKVAAGLEKGGYEGPVYQDHGWFTWIEAVGYILTLGKDPELEKLADESIDIICAAQRDDGYLNTYYILNGLEKRWTNLMDNHELFNLGHFIEGAIAYYEATGKEKILKAVMKYADLVYKNFGPGENQLHGYPGHELIEMALVKLYDITNQKHYLELAKFFIDERGKEPLYFMEECRKNNNPCHWVDGVFKFDYYQAGKPVRQQSEAIGHAVRAVYLYSGMADIARKTNDSGLFEVCEKLWKDITEKKMYITGAIGASPYGEAFSYEYNLPNDTAYAETCAAIGLFFFAHRMLLTNPDGKYSDVMERTLYNGILSGISLDGTHFFYVNPLEVVPEAVKIDHFKSHVKLERQNWFGCACCPPNISRLLASLGKYVFTAGPEDELYMHLYIGGTFSHEVKGNKVELSIKSSYPWEEDVSITFKSSTPIYFTLKLHIPGWAAEYEITVNGEKADLTIKNGYAVLSRVWKTGDKLTIRFNMTVKIDMAHTMVRNNLNLVAVSRGPVVYCAEEADNGKNLHLLSLGGQPAFMVKQGENILSDIKVITADAYFYDDDWHEKNIYADAVNPNYLKKNVTFIPYFTWANRGIGEMRVWINRIVDISMK